MLTEKEIELFEKAETRFAGIRAIHKSRTETNAPGLGLGEIAREINEHLVAQLAKELTPRAMDALHILVTKGHHTDTQGLYEALCNQGL